MRLENSIALPVQSFERNRRVFVAAALVAAPALTIASALFIFSKPVVRPLLALDESPMTERVAVVSTVEQAQVVELNADVLRSMHALSTDNENVEAVSSNLDLLDEQALANVDCDTRW